MIGKWDTSNVLDMECMATNEINCSSPYCDKNIFNADISKWKTDNVINMSKAFYYSNFNQDISQWNVGENTNVSEIFTNSGMLDENICKIFEDGSNWSMNSKCDIYHQYDDEIKDICKNDDSYYLRLCEIN